MMQGSNRTSTPRPKPGDGTQEESKTNGDANWYGASQEPQEEFIENDSRPFEASDDYEKTSEGQPTFHGTRDPRDTKGGFIHDPTQAPDAEPKRAKSQKR